MICKNINFYSTPFYILVKTIESNDRLSTMKTSSSTKQALDELGLGLYLQEQLPLPNNTCPNFEVLQSRNNNVQ